MSGLRLGRRWLLSMRPIDIGNAANLVNGAFPPNGAKRPPERAA
jgi:hypothetical protein